MKYAVVFVTISFGILIGVLGFLGFQSGFISNMLSGTATQSAEMAKSPVKSSNYSAVFLSNGQVYFGHVANAEDQFPTLTDVYYLRVTQALTPGQAGSVEAVSVEKTDKGKTATPAAQPTSVPQNEMTLIKLGNEIHGPTDEILINRDHILFIEALKEDSKVVKAITDYKEKNK